MRHNHYVQVALGGLPSLRKMGKKAYDTQLSSIYDEITRQQICPKLEVA